MNNASGFPCLKIPGRLEVALLPAKGWAPYRTSFQRTECTFVSLEHHDFPRPIKTCQLSSFSRVPSSVSPNLFLKLLAFPSNSSCSYRLQLRLLSFSYFSGISNVCQSFLYQRFYCSDFLPPATGGSPQRLPFSAFGGGYSERGGLVGQESACQAGDWVQSLGWEDPLETQMATHASILA